MDKTQVEIKDQPSWVSISSEGNIVVEDSHESTTDTIDLKDVIACLRSEDDAATLSLHYSIRKKHMLLEPRALKLKFPDEQEIGRWLKEIEVRLSESSKGRPKSLLVFVNPDSGSNKGLKLYNEKCAPYFKLAGIATHVVVTERGRQSTEMLQKYDLSRIDGVIAVGGDGTVADVINGLLDRTAKENEISPTEDLSYFPPTSVRLGVIPAGSGDGYSCITTGTRDPTSSALRIVRGDEIATNASSSFQAGNFLKWTFLMFGYGCLTDFLYWTEGWLRRLGPLRYLIGMIRSLMNYRTFHVIVEYKAAARDHSSGERIHKSDWTTRSGVYCGVSYFPNGLTASRDPSDPRPDFVRHNERMTSGIGTLLLLKPHGRWATLKFLIALGTGSKYALLQKNVELIDMTHARIKLDSDAHPLQSFAPIDGEHHFLDTPLSFEIRTLGGVLRTFASGLDEPLCNILL